MDSRWLHVALVVLGVFLWLVLDASLATLRRRLIWGGIVALAIPLITLGLLPSLSIRKRPRKESLR